MSQPDIEICICMGSSCFARGNNVRVVEIEAFLATCAPEERARVKLTGRLCNGNCAGGPNIEISRNGNPVKEAGDPVAFLKSAFNRK